MKCLRQKEIQLFIVTKISVSHITNDTPKIFINEVEDNIRKLELCHVVSRNETNYISNEPTLIGKIDGLDQLQPDFDNNTRKFISRKHTN